MQAVANDTKLTLPGSRRTTQLQSRYSTDCRGWGLRNFCTGMKLAQCISSYIADMTHMHATLLINSNRNTAQQLLCLAKLHPATQHTSSRCMHSLKSVKLCSDSPSSCGSGQRFQGLPRETSKYASTIWLSALFATE